MCTEAPNDVYRGFGKNEGRRRLCFRRIGGKNHPDSKLMGEARPSSGSSPARLKSRQRRRGQFWLPGLLLRALIVPCYTLCESC